MKPTTEFKSLSGLIAARRETGRPTHVFVSGNGGHYPDDVREVAVEVADLVAGTDGDVYECDFDRVGEGDVPLVELPRRPNRRRGDSLNDLRTLTAVSREVLYAGVVGWSAWDDIPSGAVKQHDAVVTVGIDSTRVYHVRLDSPNGECYKLRLENGIGVEQ